MQIIFFPLAALNFNHYMINLQKFYLVLFPYILGHFTVIVSFLLIFSIPFLFLDILNTHILHSVSKINKIWSIWRPDSIVCFFLLVLTDVTLFLCKFVIFGYEFVPLELYLWKAQVQVCSSERICTSRQLAAQPPAAA